MTDLFDRDDLPPSEDRPHCLALQLADPAIPTAELCQLHNLTPAELAAPAVHPNVQPLYPPRQPAHDDVSGTKPHVSCPQHDIARPKPHLSCPKHQREGMKPRRARLQPRVSCPEPRV